jgi:integrase
MLDRKEILTQLDEALRRKSSARGTYIWAVDDFLSTKPKELTVEVVLSYLDKRERTGDKPRTLKMRFYALKYLFKLLQVPFSLTEREVFSTRERRQRLPQPWFRQQEIIKIITGARANEKSTSQELSLLAIGTIYGCRRSELADIRKEDLDLNSKTITIYARKGGRVATQLLPDEILPYLESYSYPKLTDTAVSLIFNRILEKTIGSREGYGWHAIRRGLVTELRNAGVSADDRYAFLRWSQGIILETYEQYELGEIENRIFPVHPYLSAWR